MGREAVLHFFKLVLAYAAYRAGPVIRQIFKSYVVVFLGLVLVTANAAYIVGCHLVLLLEVGGKSGFDSQSGKSFMSDSRLSRDREDYSRRAL